MINFLGFYLVHNYHHRCVARNLVIPPIIAISPVHSRLLGAHNSGKHQSIVFQMTVINLCKRITLPFLCIDKNNYL